MYYTRSFVKGFKFKNINVKLTLYRYSQGNSLNLIDIDHCDGGTYTTVGSYFHLVDDDDKVYMSLSYYQLFGTRWLTSVIVEKDYRNIGIGYTVLKYFIKRYKITHLSVYENNRSARRLCEKLGFKESYMIDSFNHGLHAGRMVIMVMK